ncbi:LysM peptidoglycan-binding domain-containing protein [Brevibacillus massiliensis]|uniref:LysM peptidoglycan-binding domain-containing protein n=1 Tax=Brevibacillus massiliensis TaxID=1118054 RepID=UPI0002FDD885|nr:LysM peptidoglycan-binding domain-containing protein [Brevibacillus massiliensis]
MQIHVVQRGETLWLLSQRFGVEANQIAVLNQLPEFNILLVGQALLIPEPDREYVVQPGENLFVIARRYAISTGELAEANQLTNPALLYPGQVLTIPVTHVVRPGETIWLIARKYRTTVQAIARANQLLDPALLYPGIVLKIPDKPKPTIEVNAFTSQFGEAGVEEIRYLNRFLTYISPFAYRIQSDGSLESIQDTAVIGAAVSNQIVPVMTLANFTAEEFGSDVAHDVLSSPERQNRLLANIVETMRAKGYRGLNIDFENVLPSDRQFYNQFLQRTADRLHPEGFFVSSSLPPKVTGEQKGLLYEAQDYSVHGKILDFVVLMTYEWGYRLGPPQAISPIDQIRAVLDYATTVIPKEKILMGIELYARDWLLPHVRGREAKTFSMQQAIRLAVQHRVEIQYDPRSQSPLYRYTDEQGRPHEVWFEDARSVLAKLNLVQEYNLRGISYWELGFPFPQNWVLLNDHFRIRKYRQA